ncbi:putative caffeate O-methyltransferase [Helianthus annuus]|nr:putative caffeate O-methyltransferase [Helianthus annuus]
MNAPQEALNALGGEEELLTLMQMVAASVLPMVMKTAIELDIFELMVKVGNLDGEFTSSNIVSHLNTQNSQAVNIIERILL